MESSSLVVVMQGSSGHQKRSFDDGLHEKKLVLPSPSNTNLSSYGAVSSTRKNHHDRNEVDKAQGDNHEKGKLLNGTVDEPTFSHYDPEAKNHGMFFNLLYDDCIKEIVYYNFLFYSWRCFLLPFDNKLFFRYYTYQTTYDAPTTIPYS